MKGSPMSLWLSAANRIAGWWRGQAMAQLGRTKGRAIAALTRARRKRRRAKRS